MSTTRVDFAVVDVVSTHRGDGFPIAVAREVPRSEHCIGRSISTVADAEAGPALDGRRVAAERYHLSERGLHGGRPEDVDP